MRLGGWVYLLDPDRPGHPALRIRVGRVPRALDDLPRFPGGERRRGRPSRLPVPRHPLCWLAQADDHLRAQLRRAVQRHGLDRALLGDRGRNVAQRQAAARTDHHLRLPVQRLEHRQLEPHPGQLHLGRQRQPALRRQRQHPGRRRRHDREHHQHGWPVHRHPDRLHGVEPGRPHLEGHGPDVQGRRQLRAMVQRRPGGEQDLHRHARAPRHRVERLPVRQQVAPRAGGLLPARHAQSQPGHLVQPVALLEPRQRPADLGEVARATSTCSSRG